MLRPTLTTITLLFICVHSGSVYGLGDLGSHFMIEIQKAVSPDEVTARRSVEAGIEVFLKRAVKMLGEGTVRLRLEDIARNSPFGKHGKILVSYDEEAHPHNVVPGHPYPSIVVSQAKKSLKSGGTVTSKMEDVVGHELGHLLFGKFNDALAEPIANLFDDESTETFARQEPLALALMENIVSGKLPDFKLQKLFSYQPPVLQKICAEHSKLGSEVSREERVRYVNSIFMGDGAREEAAREYPVSPNDGPAKGPLVALGSALMQYLRELEGPDSMKKFLQFYFEPTPNNLNRLFGFASFDQLEVAFLAHLRLKYSTWLSEGSLQNRWRQYVEKVSQLSVFRSENWRPKIKGEKIQDESGKAEDEILMSFGRSLTGDERKRRPISTSMPIGSAEGVSISTYLGENWNFGKLCSRNRISSGDGEPHSSAVTPPSLSH